MSGVASGFTLVFAEDAGNAAATGYIVTDGGVLFATADHGATWRCYGLVDPELFLLDLGFEDVWDAFLTPGLPTVGRRVLAA